MISEKENIDSEIERVKKELKKLEAKKKSIDDFNDKKQEEEARNFAYSMVGKYYKCEVSENLVFYYHVLRINEENFKGKSPSVYFTPIAKRISFNFFKRKDISCAIKDKDIMGCTINPKINELKCDTRWVEITKKEFEKMHNLCNSIFDMAYISTNSKISKEYHLHERIEARLIKYIKENKLGSFLTDEFIDKMIADAIEETKSN